MKRLFGLIGNNLEYSFSKHYFEEKFKKEKIPDTRYINLQIENINHLKEIIQQNTISGFNVTIPFKIDIISLLDDITSEAKEIGSVNTVKLKGANMKGYNTDVIGFKESIIPLIKNRKKALILGNGGSSKTVQYVLSNINIEYTIVSRGTVFDYHNIDSQIIDCHDIIINTTPLGMFPNTTESPKIPYQLLNKKHLLYDLVYNPVKTQFLAFGELYGSEIKNGLEMLEIQAKEAWKIWNS